MLLIVKRVDENNIGDVHCNPADYFPELGPTKTTDIFRRFDYDNISAVVLGGGGMFHFVPQLQELLLSPRHLICWSAGANTHDTDVLDYAGIDLGRFALLGLRDRGVNHLPCVSCMNPLLVPRAGYGVRCFLHKDQPFDVGPFPSLNNSEKSLAKVINFLNGAETIVSNTYHGVVWSVWLGKRVILYRPFSNKFFHLPWDVPIARTPADVIRLARENIKTYLKALEQAREANRAFAKRVVEMTKPQG